MRLGYKWYGSGGCIGAVPMTVMSFSKVGCVGVDFQLELMQKKKQLHQQCLLAEREKPTFPSEKKKLFKIEWRTRVQQQKNAQTTNIVAAEIKIHIDFSIRAEWKIAEQHKQTPTATTKEEYTEKRYMYSFFHTRIVQRAYITLYSWPIFGASACRCFLFSRLAYLRIVGVGIFFFSLLCCTRNNLYSFCIAPRHQECQEMEKGDG